MRRREDVALLHNFSSQRLFRSPGISRCSWTLCALLKVSFQSAWRKMCCDRLWRRNSEWPDCTPWWSARCLLFNWTTSTSHWRTTSKTLHCFPVCVRVDVGQRFSRPRVCPGSWWIIAPPTKRLSLPWRPSWSCAQRWPDCSLSKSTYSKPEWLQTTEGRLCSVFDWVNRSLFLSSDMLVMGTVEP